MADTATAVGIVPAAESGALAAEANRAVRPVSMSVVASGVGTAVTPVRRDHREVLRWTSRRLVWQDLLILASAAL